MTTRVLVCVAGAETPGFWTHVRDLLPPDAAVDLFHVIDDAAARELEMRVFRRPGHPPPRTLDERARAAEQRGSDAILDDAARALGLAADVAVGRGRPEQEIVRRAIEGDAALVIVASRPGEDATEPGPHSLGHVARFVVDHAPCPVLVVRLTPARPFVPQPMPPTAPRPPRP